MEVEKRKGEKGTFFAPIRNGKSPVSRKKVPFFRPIRNGLIRKKEVCIPHTGIMIRPIIQVL